LQPVTFVGDAKRQKYRWWSADAQVRLVFGV